MTEEKPYKIDIPESVEGYTVTLFWGLTIKQIVLVFIATLFVGFGIFTLFNQQYMTTLAMFSVTALVLLGVTEVRGRNFYRYILFIFFYYKSKPRVLVYNHYPASGIITTKTQTLVYQKEDNTKTFILIFVALIAGLALLLLTAWYITHVIAQ